MTLCRSSSLSVVNALSDKVEVEVRQRAPTEPLSDLHMANQCIDAQAPNAHSRVATLELTVTAPDPWRRKRIGHRDLFS